MFTIAAGAFVLATLIFVSVTTTDEDQPTTSAPRSATTTIFDDSARPSKTTEDQVVAAVPRTPYACDEEYWEISFGEDSTISDLPCSGAVIVVLPDDPTVEIRCELFASVEPFEIPPPRALSTGDFVYDASPFEGETGFHARAERNLVVFERLPSEIEFVLILSRITFDRRSFEIYDVQRIGALADDESRRITAPVPRATSELRGRVVDGDGVPIEGARVRFLSEACRLPGETKTDADGAFIVRDAPRGRVDVLVETSAVVSRTSFDVRFPVESILVATPRRAVATLRIFGPDGAPPDCDFGVVMRRPPRSGGSSTSETVDSGFEFRQVHARPLGEGRYAAEVAADACGAFYAAYGGRRFAASFGPGAFDPTLTLPVLGELVVSLRDDRPADGKGRDHAPRLRVTLRDLLDEDAAYALYAVLDAARPVARIPLAPGRFAVGAYVVDDGAYPAVSRTEDHVEFEVAPHASVLREFTLHDL